MEGTRALEGTTAFGPPRLLLLVLLSCPVTHRFPSCYPTPLHLLLPSSALPPTFALLRQLGSAAADLAAGQNDETGEIVRQIGKYAASRFIRIPTQYTTELSRLPRRSHAERSYVTHLALPAEPIPPPCRLTDSVYIKVAKVAKPLVGKVREVLPF